MLPKSLTSQTFDRICQRRFYRLETNGDQGNDYSRYPRSDEHPYADADAVGVLLKPIVQVIERHRRGNDAADDHQHDKIAGEQQPNLRYGSAQYFADADLLGALFGNVSGQPEQPQAGYKYSQPGEHARQLAHKHLQVKLVLILVVHKLVLVGVSRVIFSKHLADLFYRGMRTGVFRQSVRHHKPEGIMSENGRLHRAIRRIHQRVFYHADDPYRFFVEIDGY